MKKFLSLALALVMTLSLVTISASATFTDDSDIVYDEAVAVLTAIEVVGGYANGSFDPDATLTRGAAAKIICNLMLGPTVAAALGTNTDPFPDVSADHTFAGYIAYCANEGIISGYTDGTFRPSGTITGYAFMKMLLGALGYDSDVEGYTATNWAVNVSADAKVAGLDDGNEDYDGSKAITREEACLYALNTLTAEVVEYDNQSNITIGDIVITNSSSAKTIANTGTDVTTYGTNQIFLQTSFAKLLDSTDSTDFGAPAVKWTYKSETIGTYVDPADLIASYSGKVTKATIYSLLGSDLLDDIDATTATLDVYVDGLSVADETDGSSYIGVKNSSTSIQNASGTAITGNGAYTEVYLEEDASGNDVVTIVVINTYAAQATADYDADDEVLEIALLDSAKSLVEDELSIDDFAVADFEEDDYLLVTAVFDGYDYEVITVAAAEIVTGEVTSYSIANNNIYLDGTKYTYNQTVADGDKATSATVGEEATLVVDTYGEIVWIDSLTAGSDKYVYVEKFDSTSAVASSSYTFYASAYFVDGSYAVIEIDEIYGDGLLIAAGDTDLSAVTDVNPDVNAWGVAIDNGTDNNDAEPVDPNTWFTYTENDDGSYNLFDVESDYASATHKDSTSATATITNGTIAFGTVFNSTEYMLANSSTVFVVLDDDDDVTVYTGISNVPTISNAVRIDTVHSATSNYAKYVFVDASAASSSIDGAGNSVSDYVFILDLNSTTVYSSSITVYEYDAIVDGELTTVEIKNDSADYSYKLYKEMTEVDGYMKLGSDVTDNDLTDASDDDYMNDTAGTFYSVSYASNVLTIGGDSFYVDDDADIWNIVMATSNYKLTDTDVTTHEVNSRSGAQMKSFYNGYVADGTAWVVFDDGVAMAVYFVADYVVPTAGVSFTQPTDATVATSNGTVTLDATATSETGAGSLSYQWKTADGSDATGTSTNATYTASDADASYYCVITNVEGGVTYTYTTDTATVTSYATANA